MTYLSQCDILITSTRKGAIMKNQMYKARQRFGYSQDEAANYVGISREQWNRIERGKCEPGVKLALMISVAFEMPVDELFELEDKDYFESQ